VPVLQTKGKDASQTIGRSLPLTSGSVEIAALNRAENFSDGSRARATTCCQEKPRDARERPPR
jgi:hypothetical protein